MTTPSAVSAVVARPARRPPGRYHARARDLPRLVLYAWAALFLNVLAPGGESLIPVPHFAMQLLAQGSLLVAVLFALLANRRLVLRPNLLLVLLSVLAVTSFIVSLHNEFIVGSVYRGFRLITFVAVLWLLSPWWGRRDLVLLRAHRVCLWVVLVSVVVGAVLAPGMAFSFGGRLSGTLWPVPPTQVAHYAALIFGTSAILWMCRIITGRHALLGVAIGTVTLIGTHTRTALLGAAIGLGVASASLFLGHTRARRVSVTTLVGVMAGTLLFAPQIVTWLARGQSVSEASQLTGRTQVWSDVFAAPRPPLEEFFGSGLSNKSYEGLAIDSNWVATYVDQGWFGMVIEASLLVLLLLAAVTHVRGPRRALALFIIVYAIVASITETGLGDASPYLLDLAVAASLLASPTHRDGPADGGTP
jgi:hypothetical protein